MIYRLGQETSGQELVRLDSLVIEHLMLYYTKLRYIDVSHVLVLSYYLVNNKICLKQLRYVTEFKYHNMFIFLYKNKYLRI